MAFAAIFKDLMVHLGQEMAHIEEQKRVLVREREHLIRRDMEGILDCINQKEALKAQALVLDESRKLLVERISGFIHGPKEDVTLTRISQLVEEPQRREVLEVKWRLENLLSQVEELSDGNRYLIRAALGHVSRSLGFLSQFQPGNPATYDDEGRVRSRGFGSRRVEQQV